MGNLSRFLRLLPALALTIPLLSPGQLSAAVSSDVRPRVLFLHHSVGANLIDQGNVRALFAAEGYDFWDHGYNVEGLRDPKGDRVEPGFDILNDNTDPDGFAAIFAQPVHNPPDNTLSYALAYDVIVFKSCFPNSDIAGDEQLSKFKAIYLGIRSTMDRYPDRLFVVITSPPLSPAATRPENAARARVLANWLRSDEYLRGHPNVVTFDLFDALADGSNTLRAEYLEPAYPIDFTSLGKVPSSALNVFRTVRAMVFGRPTYSADSHPNLTANRKVGPLFVQSIVQAHRQFATR